jgi:predicted RNA binding protein YcfA (HicA-like mRNA interferase family)
MRNCELEPTDASLRAVPLKVRDVIRMIQADGWFEIRQRGSHRQFKHPIKRGLVTVAGKPGDELAPGTANSVLKQAGLK